MTTEAAGRGPGARVLLYLPPLGAGDHFVRWNGRLYEALAGHREHRPAQDLYHSALEVRLDGDRFVIEMARYGPFGTPTGAWCAKDQSVRLARPLPRLSVGGAGAWAGFPT